MSRLNVGERYQKFSVLSFFGRGVAMGFDYFRGFSCVYNIVR